MQQFNPCILKTRLELRRLNMKQCWAHAVLWIGMVLIPIRIRIRIFHVVADTDPDPDWHQNDADPHADSSPSLHMLENKIFKITFSHSIVIYNVISFSSVSNISYFLYLFINFFICLELIPIRIRKIMRKCGSGSKTGQYWLHKTETLVQQD